MKIFKFGGASTKDAENIKNVFSVINLIGEKDLVVVISAMGKMTNALEEVVNDYFKSGIFDESLKFVSDFHLNIIKELFPNNSNLVYSELEVLFTELNNFLLNNKSKNHAFVYDQVVSYGEIISSKIISIYFAENQIQNTWLDVRQCIKTDDSFRDARVDWKITEQKILEIVSPIGITITQGFIGAETTHNFTTTLGREGSDYTAAIFAYCLNA